VWVKLCTVGMNPQDPSPLSLYPLSVRLPDVEMQSPPLLSATMVPATDRPSKAPSIPSVLPAMVSSVRLIPLLPSNESIPTVFPEIVVSMMVVSATGPTLSMASALLVMVLSSMLTVEP